MHDIETYAGTAGVYFSQGADKIQIYNLLVPMRNSTSERGWWLVFTSIGSYEKLMTMNRKVLVTFKDEVPLWCRRDESLPRTIQTNDSVFVLRIGMGDIPNGGTATLKFSSDVIDADNPPTVFVNPEECRFIGVEDSTNLVRTKNQLYCFEITEKVHGNMYAVAEIQSPNIKGSDETKVEMTIDYAEVYITPGENK